MGESSGSQGPTDKISIDDIRKTLQEMGPTRLEVRRLREIEEAASHAAREWSKTQPERCGREQAGVELNNGCGKTVELDVTVGGLGVMVMHAQGVLRRWSDDHRPVEAWALESGHIDAWALTPVDEAVHRYEVGDMSFAIAELQDPRTFRNGADEPVHAVRFDVAHEVTLTVSWS